MSDAPAGLPPRPPDGHKGTFGTVCVIGGQACEPRVMLGGPAFAALGALRAGAGLAVLAAPAPLLAPMLVAAPSATGLALPVDDRGSLMPSQVAALIDAHRSTFDVLAIGPGLGDGVPQQQIVARLIAADDLPIVLDADAINALAQLRDLHLDVRGRIVLTPHPGEYRRLARALGIDADPVAPDSRVDAAEQLARRLGCVVVLKGQRTIVSDGIQTAENPTGNVALATAGTGDVLTGIIAGIVAQHLAPRPPTPHGDRLSLFDCARLGAHLHGLAADRWAARHGSAGMLAADLLDEIPDALGELSVD